MKRIVKSFAIAAVSALAFISCSQEQNPVSKDNGIHFTIRTSENPQVKSFIESDFGGKYIPKWSKGDELAMFVGDITENTKATGVLTNVNETNEVAKFDGTVTGLPTNGSFKSFAPASAFAASYNSGNIGVTLKETQNPTSIKIDEACDILVAKETTYTADAIGKVEIVDLFFKRMFSIVKIALNGPASLNGEKVSKFSLTAPEGTILTGRAAIDLATASIDKWIPNLKNNSVTATYSEDAPLFGGEAGLENEVWLVVNPGTIESGAKVVFAGETANYTFSKEVTLSKALTFPESQLAVINLTLAEENCTKKAAASWIATDLADITATDEVVITMAKDGAVYAMTSDNGTKNPSAVDVTVKDGELSAAPADNLVWNIANDKGNLTIYPKGQTDKWLCSVSGQTNVKVDNSTTCNIFTLDPKTKYLKNTGANRYLGVYKTTDWRAYASATGTSAIAGQTLCFYVKGTPKTALETPANLQVSNAKVVSWNAVSGAASYEVTIGENTFTSETTSYDAAAIADDYYDVAVVAVPSDKENFKNSAAATLTGVKFGTPTLATPTLKEGVIDGASISVSWSVDERATAGYNCELFKGGVKVGESQTVNAGTVTFTGLDAETAYVVKVNAIAVEGAKAYAASSVATLDVRTKAASATANDGSLERPYTAAEAIAAIDANTGLTGKYVKGIVKATPSFNATYSSLTYDIESGENTLNIYSGKDLGNAGFVEAEDLKVGDEVVVYGDLKKYNNTYELDKNNYLISINGETQIYRGLAVSEPKTAFTVGDTFKLGGKVLQVWRGKEDVDITASATFSGYDMSTEGKQTITVTVGEESVTYEITINPAGTVPPTTVTKTISEISGTTESGKKVSSMIMDDVITLSASTGGNNGKVYTNGAEWRLYQSDKGTMTVSSKSGYIIESITVTFTVSNKGTLLYNSDAVTSGKAVAVSGSSIKFTLGNTSTATNGQIRITAISVTYKQQ